MENEEKLEKIYIDLPEHWATGGESLWAFPLGNNLYELRNIPFRAYGLNFGDVVRALSESQDLKPEVIEIKKSNGHKTLRVHFNESVEIEKRREYLSQLHAFRAFYENANDKLFAIDIEPDGDYESVCNKLNEWENQGILEYETCEFRVPGRFDLDSSEDK